MDTGGKSVFAEDDSSWTRLEDLNNILGLKIAQKFILTKNY